MVSRGTLAISALWVVGVFAATSVGLVAVHLVGREVGNQVGAPLTRAGVAQALSSAGSTPASSERPEASQEPAAQLGEAGTVVTTGGVVSARCADNRPTLLYATPKDGYQTEHSGTATRALVSFVGQRRRVTVTMTCQDDHLLAFTRTVSLGTPSHTQSPAPQATPAETPEPEPSGYPEPSASEDHSGTDH